MAKKLPEGVKITVIDPIRPELKEFLAMEPGPRKNHKFDKIRNDLGACFASSILEYPDGKKCYSESNLTIKKKGRSFYLMPNAKKGFGIEANGKLKLWFGQSIFNTPGIKEMLEYLKIDWLTNQDQGWFTKTSLEKVFNGQITNQVDFYAAFLKSSRIKASPKLFYKAVKCGAITNRYELHDIVAVIENFDHYLEYKIHDKELEYLDTNCKLYPHLSDLIKQAMILEEKINIRWSHKRLDNLHTDFTRRIMLFEGVGPDGKVQYEFRLPEAPEGFELLDTKIRIHHEGMVMSNCTYTNYLDKVMNGNYVLYHVIYKGEHASLGFNVKIDYQYGYGKQDKRRYMVYNQCYAKYNKAVSQELKNYVMSWYATFKDVDLPYQDNNVYESLFEEVDVVQQPTKVPMHVRAAQELQAMEFVTLMPDPNPIREQYTRNRTYEIDL